MGTNHSEVAFFIFQNSIDTYQGSVEKRCGNFLN